MVSAFREPHGLGLPHSRARGRDAGRRGAQCLPTAGQEPGEGTLEALGALQEGKWWRPLSPGWGGGGFRCRPRARPQGVTAKRPSGEGWLLTSGSEQSLSQGQRWPHAGAKGNFSSQVPVPGKCRGLDCLGLSGCCQQSRWAGGERDRRGEMPAARGSLSLEEHLVFL